VRPDPAGDGENIFRGGHLQIKLPPDGLFDSFDIEVVNVTSVLPEVRDDTVGPGGLT